MNLQQELDRAIGHGPPLPTPEERLRAGRDAVRRRRITVGAAAATVLVAIAAPFALGAGGAGSPEVTASPPPPASEVADDPWRGTGGVRFDEAGTLQISPHAVVHERRDGVEPGFPSSVALDLTFRGERTWRVTRPTNGGNALAITSAPGEEPDLYRNFDEFVAKATFSFQQGVNPLSDPGALVLDDIDGMPDVAGAGTAIGPLVRGDERAFGFETESGGERQFVLLLRASEDSWRVERIEAATAEPDLATWLRLLSWLPTGEEPS